MAKILLIEDDQQLAGVVKAYLVFQKHSVEALHTGSGASDHLKVYPYDLLILDWDLPVTPGIEILRDYRNRGGSMPILMLTGRDKIDDKEAGFSSGADDYLPKPFEMRELGMRVGALLRRREVMPASILKVGQIELNPGSHEISVAGIKVDLMPMEFRVLEFLMRHPNEVFLSEVLLNRVWPSESESTEEALRSVMKRLRKKVDPDSAVIKTVRGIGYIVDSGSNDSPA
jgi:DNA-binding response OmpR family regulator